MSYVDGFLLSVPKANLEAYKEHARVSADVWMEHGATSYVESLAEDVPYGELTSFPRAVQAKDDEIVVFAWATYPDKAKRDEVMKKVFEDPRMKPAMENMQFDGKRMIYGGFDAFIER
jgi:uncharacterized protein YbaA (DUF1428 family)